MLALSCERPSVCLLICSGPGKGFHLKVSAIHLNNLPFLGPSVLWISVYLEICSCLEITAPKYHHNIELSMALAAELAVVVLPASPQMDDHIHQGLKSLSCRVADNYGLSNCIFYISADIDLN